jgi:4-diphosphocytidyl-2-C-methyl-D-erythritol kinase
VSPAPVPVPMHETAPAKLNLYLHVLGRRADGYHVLDSLVAFADIGDEVAAAPARSLSLDIAGPFAPGLAADASNLVWRAATALAQRLGRAPDAALTLAKNLPVASGIGGGSSDAAATLRALLALWRAELAPEALHEIAAALGADVPVCLARRTAWLGGIGEEVSPAPLLPPVGLVLANPGIALPTAEVFRRRAGAFSQAARFTQAPRDAADLAALLAQRRNDLTAAACAHVPEIGDVLARLAASDGALLARMSGSGATCFALYATRDRAAAAAARIKADRPRWWVAAGKLL